MGCFDVTCCISGLSIRHDEPIYFGIVVPTEFGHDRSHDVCNLWQFLLPPFEGKYDDYGFVEEKTIKPRKMWDWLVDLWAPHLVPLKNYPNHSETDKPKEIFDDFICSRRAFKNPLQKDAEVRCSLWYCHKWAFEAVEEAELPSWFKSDRGVETIERYVMNGYLPEEVKKRFEELDKQSYEKLSADERKEWRTIHRNYYDHDFHDVEWSGGFFSPYFRHIFTDYKTDQRLYHVLGENRDSFKKSLIRLQGFISRLWCIRKNIMPDVYQGEQHDDHSNLIPWTALVAKQAKLLKKQREE